MSYTITDTGTGERHEARTRTDAVKTLGAMGLNHYVAVRLLDAADGLMALDFERPITVTRDARRVVDFHLDGSPVYAD